MSPRISRERLRSARQWLSRLRIHEIDHETELTIETLLRVLADYERQTERPKT